ncbi:MAG TPA: protein-L-isoaspartate(D-aspartate) O-methyltransferase [Methylomirabilota bacterium]|nr:protein-L-isoaspartate(D-aspartate) O-methyltransferase [Methylomirabilota bacterium]
MSWAIWITGLPGSGKSAIARAVAARLHAAGEDAMVLELDAIRRVLTPAPTYSDAEREGVYRALVYIGACLVEAGVPVIFDATAHRRAWRDLARATIANFAEVQLRCPLDVCRQREAARPRGAAPAGIYARSTRPGARVPGVNVEYEFAHSPELTVDTVASDVAAAADAVVALIRGRLLGPAPAPAAAGALDERLLVQEGPEEQVAISRRARAYAARLERQATARRRRGPRSFAEARERMVDLQISGRGIRDPAVLAAMRKVPRECFVSAVQADVAYDDSPLPIGAGQTISQPYVVAVMTEALGLRAGDRVLEIGTGSGYAAAVLAVIAAQVYTIERIESLAEQARRRLAELGYTNVDVRCGDGSLGWPEHAPYDAIVVTAGGPDVPRSLLRQMAVGGRLVMPVGSVPRFQRLVRVVRTGEGTYDRETLEDVAFVPLIGAEGWSTGKEWP